MRVPTATIDAMDPVRVLAHLGGAARLETLDRHGVSRGLLRRGVARGEVLKPLYGCYCLPGTSRADLLAASYRAKISCVSLCERAGLPLGAKPDAVHLVVPRDRGRRHDDRRPAGVVLHRVDAVWESDAQVSGAIDLAGDCVSEVDQLALVDAGLRAGIVTEEDVLGFKVSTAGRIEWLLDHADARAESYLETRTRVLLTGAGLQVRPQVAFSGVGRVDLLVEDVLVVEADGRSFHDNADAFTNDRRRDRGLAIRGVPVLRFTYDDVVAHPDRVVADVMDVLARLRR